MTNQWPLSGDFDWISDYSLLLLSNTITYFVFTPLWYVIARLINFTTLQKRRAGTDQNLILFHTNPTFDDPN